MLTLAIIVSKKSYADRREENIGYIMEEAIQRFESGPSEHTSTKIEASLKEAINYDANVTQLPDGDTSVLGKSGTHSMMGINLNFHHKPKAKEKPLNFKLNFGETRYFETFFKTRNSKSITLALEKAFKRPTRSRFMNYTLKLNQRFDFLYAFGEKERGFETTTPSIMGILKPKKIKNKMMDLLIPIIGFDLEFRNFVGNYGSDISGISKDSITPAVTGIFLSMKKHKKFKSRAMCMLNIKNVASDSQGQEYTSARINLSWTAIIKQFEIMPNTTISLRDQSNYQGNKREDQKYEAGISCKCNFNKKKTSLKAQLQFTKQRANLSAFIYNNTRFALAGSHKF